MRGLRRCLVALTVVAGLALWLRRRDRPLTGALLGVPYDLRLPTPAVLRERFWNPLDPRLLTPHVLGWGYSVNLYTLGRRLGLLE